ncbi:MAG: flagellar hook-basal body complex protein FliE [Candidatus Thorarchaeota archaeon]|nr:MAG: flagellar hook-basal body complex protein FliE [Candidatus Thorarchaeota archaeon]
MTLKIIIITGMPGAGKSEVANAFKNAGFPLITMGDVIREETRNRGMEATPENTKKIMLELRELHGPGAVATRCLDGLCKQESDIVVIEGCRSIAEIDVFNDYVEELKIICVHASPKIRFSRLRERNREDAPSTWEIFRERDIREISVGLGGVIALSDIMLINEGTINDIQNSSKELVAKLI